MPNLKSPTKELRKNKRKRLRNLTIKSELKTLEKKLQRLIADKKIDEAKDALKILCAKLDKAASKKIIRKEKAARKTSRIHKRLNKIA